MASYKKDVPFIPDEMKSPEPSEVARRLGQVIYDGLLYTSAENIALCLEDYAQSQNAALRAEVEALRARVAEVADKARQRSKEHHALAREYQEAKDEDMSYSSLTLSRCYGNVADWLEGKSE